VWGSCRVLGLGEEVECILGVGEDPGEEMMVYIMQRKLEPLLMMGMGTVTP
jgi:hypothetical protein